MKIAVCEDEKIYSDLLCSQIEKFFSEHGSNADISVFNDGAPLIESVKSGAGYDIIFLDIQLENSDGMETAAAVRTTDRNSVIIFVTGLEDRAVEGYSVSAFDYIVKSTLTERLGKVLDRFMKKYESSTVKFQLHSGETVIVSLADILWIESDGRGTRVVTADKEYSVNIPVSRTADMLSSDMFTEVHKSVFVQTGKIRNIGTDTVEMCDGRTLPMSRRKRKDVMTAVMNVVRG